MSESGGWFDECSDETILQAQKLLAQSEGIFCEPASAASLAGAIRDIQSGKIAEGSTIVLTLTGNGLKDPDTAIGQCQGDAKMVTVGADLESVRAAILHNMS
jgi:threonine synthase